MIYREWGVNNWVLKNQPKEVVLVPLHETSTRLHLQYHTKTHMAEIIATRQWEQPLLTLSRSHHLPLLFLSLPNPYPSHLLFFFSSSSHRLNLLSSHMQTYTQGRADRNPRHRKGEEEETKNITEDDDAWLRDGKSNLRWLYLLCTQWKTTWPSCLQWNQGLSRPKWWKMCTSHHMKGMDDMSSEKMMTWVHKQHHI